MARKYFDVLVRTPHGLKWKPVDDCSTHAEARDQGNAQYAGEILQTRFNGIKNDDNSRKSSGSYGGGEGSFELAMWGLGIIVALGILSFIWPLVVGVGVIYCIVKLYKWIIK